VLKSLRGYGITAPIDVHLMIKPVDRIVPDFAKAGASLISFHPEASEHIDRTIGLIKESGCQAGLVFNPATPLDHLDYVMDKLDMILIMSVNPGFGGQKFIPGTLEKLRQVRERIEASGREIRLEVDGGVGDVRGNTIGLAVVAVAAQAEANCCSGMFHGKEPCQSQSLTGPPAFGSHPVKISPLPGAESVQPERHSAVDRLA
jgi:ribulose-phosphate 3-epimerase